ncbi:MAG: hypothetical protein IKZ87_00160 [Actinomycetaceae bacterium]|nr:hypothetical protein [Actinomycetaceae bacterium]
MWIFDTVALVAARVLNPEDVPADISEDNSVWAASREDDGVLVGSSRAVVSRSKIFPRSWSKSSRADGYNVRYEDGVFFSAW